MQFQRARAEVPIEQHDAFESMLIDKGQLLPNRQGQKSFDSTDTFRDALAEFRATHGREPTPGAADDAAGAMAAMKQVQGEAADARKKAAKDSERKRKVAGQ